MRWFGITVLPGTARLNVRALELCPGESEAVQPASEFGTRGSAAQAVVGRGRVLARRVAQKIPPVPLSLARRRSADELPKPSSPAYTHR